MKPAVIAAVWVFAKLRQSSTIGKAMASCPCVVVAAVTAAVAAVRAAAPAVVTAAGPVAGSAAAPAGSAAVLEGSAAVLWDSVVLVVPAVLVAPAVVLESGCSAACRSSDTLKTRPPRIACKGYCST